MNQTITVWLDGNGWSVKRQDDVYFYRSVNYEGAWTPGLPPGAEGAHVENMFVHFEHLRR